MTPFNPSRAKASAGDVGALDEDDDIDIAIELAVGDVAAVVLLAEDDDLDIAKELAVGDVAAAVLLAGDDDFDIEI